MHRDSFSMTKKPSRVILNKEIDVVHYKSSFITEKIIRTQQFKVKSFLNFEENFLQVDFEDFNEDIHCLKVIEVSFNDSARRKKRYINFKQSRKRAQINGNPKIKVDLKNVLLKMFNVEGNEFTIEVLYNWNDDIACSVYKISLPCINDQKKWIPNAIQMKNVGIEESTTDEIKNLYLNDFQLTDDSSSKEMQLRNKLNSFIKSPWEHKTNHYNLVQIFRIQLMIEELKQNEDLKKYQLNDQMVQSYASASLELKSKMVEHVSKHLCFKKANKYLLNAHFIVMRKRKMPFNSKDIEGLRLTEMDHCRESPDIKTTQIKIGIDYIVNNEIIIFHTAPDVHLGDRYFNVQYITKPVLMRMAHHALTKIDLLNANDYLINFDSPASSSNLVRDSEINYNGFSYKNKSIDGNIEAQIAIKDIFNGSAFPSPYLLCGPAGSGKTTIIIESILQIVDLKPNAQILVVVSNNTACNEIGDYLMEFISCNKILRVYSSSFERQQNPDKLSPKCRSVEMCGDCESRYCNELQACMNNPCYEEFYIARVVIVTLAGSGSLVNAGVKSDHFDYIFIDDAASVPESFTLIPTVGLATRSSGQTFKITANIILSGDPAQLGPTVMHPFNLKLGMDCSMIERMIRSMEKYSCETVDIADNLRYVTQLLNCFRSHKAILRFAYMTFYCGTQLRSRVPSEEENFALDWKHLKNRDFPIMFMDTQYNDDCEVFGKVLMKKMEINVINYYVNSLLVHGINGHKVLQEDIGVISMDLEQSNTLIDQLKSCYSRMEIGTVESFQGREKKIIFVSTVRTGTKNNGFKKKDRRLLVALTRARSLLVVVGNTDKLLRCDRWSKFIMYCINNNAYVEAPIERPIGAMDDDYISSDDEDDSDEEDNYDGLFEDFN